MKKELLKKITEEESKLHIDDAEGHIWWNKFRILVESIKDTEMIGEACENCQADFYRRENEEKHKSGLWLCGSCKLNW